MNIFKKKNQEFIISPQETEKIELLFKNTITQLFPNTHTTTQIIPLFNSEKYYKHLKKMMWKFSRK